MFSFKPPGRNHSSFIVASVNFWRSHPWDSMGKSLKTSAINSYSNPIPIIPLVTSQREVVSFVVLS
jgi:hypothetical protein